MVKKLKKNLLVTLADKNYVKQAKQLFSSVYFNAGWPGDYMLLAYDIPEKKLKWFREKGILIKKVRPEKHFKFKKEWVKISSLKKHSLSFNSRRNYVFKVWQVTSSKFFLFTPYFKQWKNIIYLDSDIIVKNPLDELTRIKEFAACLNYTCPKLLHQFSINSNRIVCAGDKIINIGVNRINDRLISKLREHYDLESTGFNSGVMAFNTNIITDKTFSKIKSLFNLYGKLSFCGFYEQGLLNLLFHKKWIPLPMSYNIYAYYLSRTLKIRPEKLKAIILHFIIKKPWNSKNKNDYFYKEWEHNLERANLINLKKPKKPKKWSNWKIKIYSLYLKIRYFLYHHKDSLNLQNYIYIDYIDGKNYINRKIGLFGIFLKNRSPKIYYYLKKSIMNK